MWGHMLGAAPLKAYSRVVRALAGIHLPPWLRRVVLPMISRMLRIDLSEAEKDLDQYISISELFVRRLRPGVRPIDEAPDAVVAPVDGCVSAAGEVAGQRLLQAKGLDYTLAELLRDDALAQRLEGGSFATIYLRPKDYHRIHAPLDGQVLSMRRVPGKLFPVQPSVVRQLRRLFVRNERLVLEFQTEFGPAAVVCVGAAAVGGISTTFSESGAPYQRFDPPITVRKGQEIAAFNLGSTVILVLPAAGVELVDLATGQELRVGQVLGRCKGAYRARDIA